jgi:SET and MYND domain-containing protein
VAIDALLLAHVAERSAEDAVMATESVLLLVLNHLVTSDEQKRHEVYDLCSLAVDALRPSLHIQVAAAVQTALEALIRVNTSTDQQLETEARLWELALRVQCNAISYWDDEYRQRAMGLFTTPSMLNHSCCPTVGKLCLAAHDLKVLSHEQLFLARHARAHTQARDWLSLSLVALKEIAAGEELCLSYVPSDFTVQERAELLVEYFAFRCDCVRCEALSSTDIAVCKQSDRCVSACTCGGWWMPCVDNDACYEGHVCSICGVFRPPTVFA